MWNNYKFNLICLLWFIPFALSSQRYIIGCITDMADGKPIPGVTVFLTNTAVGTATDIDGKYQLRIPSEGSYQLTVSHVGYKAVIKDIEHGNTSVTFDVALQSVELEELTVVKKIRFRQTDISLFWKTILGKNPSRRTIQATNPETVYYYYNPETKILKVTCREPLEIINYETGYKIQYILENFTHNYSTNTTEWNCQPKYTELTPENDRQKSNWDKKRQEVYKTSLTKFIKSLYNNSLYEDGFVLGSIKENQLERNPYRLTLLTPDKIITSNTNDNSKILNLSNSYNEHVMLVCYGRPVKEFDLRELQDAINVTGKWSGSGLFRNILSGGLIRIFPDGTYTNKINMTPMDISDPVNGLAYVLPLDYLADGSISSTTTDIAENVSDFDKVVQLFDRQLSVFPQEKIHLHTDRNVYVSGEKIWFKAYVTDALTHKYPTPSRYVYVELISPADTLMHRVMIQQADGMFYGHIPLTEYVPTGNYTLRAYTRHMENLGDDYFFKKNIRIENLAIAQNQKRPTANRDMLKDDYEISFFPEGGNLPEGVMSRVAFKAINSNGYPETVSGMLLDENGAEIASVETFHAGMGVFEYIPAVGKRIFLKCKNTKGLEKQFTLPQPNPKAYSLAAYRNNNELIIEVHHAVQSPDIPCYLLAHCRGKVLHFSEWDKKEKDISFTEEEFPAGIIQFVLFDKQMNPLSERLVFNKNFTNDVGNIEFQTDKSSYGKREKVIATIKPPQTPPQEGNAPSSLGRAGEGTFSIAITDDHDITVDSTTTILSSLLLSSELKGYIENPAYYLQENPASVTALDYLMLTHGWRRYDIPEVVKGNSKHPKIPFQLNQEISGKVKNPVFSRTVPDCEILIMARDGDVGFASTDENGLFKYQDFEFPDSASFMIQALSKKGSARVTLVMNEESFPKLIHATQSPHLTDLTPALSKKERVETDKFPSSSANAFMEKAEQRARYDEDMWMINLDEVEITARRINRRYDDRLQYWANENSNETIRREDIEKFNMRYTSDYLQLIPGVTVNIDGSVFIRSFGSSNRAGRGLPLVLVDGIEQAWPDSTETKGNRMSSPLDAIPVSSIESIDVFKGPSAAVFGMRGANGAISITTRRGKNSPFMEKANFTVYNPLGYQKPVEFYSPKYETLEAKNTPIPDFRTTIFWKPDLTIQDDGQASFEFYTSDFPTTYSVVIEGLTTDGKIVRQVEKIQVK